MRNEGESWQKIHVWLITRLLSNEKRNITTAIRDKKRQDPEQPIGKKGKVEGNFQEILNCSQPEHPLEAENERQALDETKSHTERRNNQGYE